MYFSSTLVAIVTGSTQTIQLAVCILCRFQFLHQAIITPLRRGLLLVASCKVTHHFHLSADRYIRRPTKYFHARMNVTRSGIEGPTIEKSVLIISSTLEAEGFQR